jgi:hypothetical protein
LLQNKNALERPITASNAIHFGKPFAWTIIYINSRFTTEYEKVKLIIFKCKYCVLILYHTNYAAFTILLFLSFQVTVVCLELLRQLMTKAGDCIHYLQSGTSKKKNSKNIFFCCFDTNMLLTDINNEVLTCIAGHLTLKDLRVFSQVCHKLALVAHSDAVWKEQLYNTFGVTYKLPEESWKDMYERKSEDPNDCKICPHVGCVDGNTLKPYAAKYQQVLNWLPKNLNCATCGTNCKDTGLCLYIWKGNVRNRMYTC